MHVLLSIVNEYKKICFKVSHNNVKLYAKYCDMSF